MHKGDYKRIIDQGYKVCCKLLEMENGLLKESMLGWRFLLCFFFSFMVHKVRDTFVWKLNGGQNKKIMGGGGEGRRQWERPPAINPLRFMKRPFQSWERRSWLTCDVTCFEVWHQPSHNVKQTVMPNSLMLSLLNCF